MARSHRSAVGVGSGSSRILEYISMTKDYHAVTIVFFLRRPRDSFRQRTHELGLFYFGVIRILIV